MSRDIANQFRMLALEAVATASEMSDPECRRAMQAIAAAFERLADRLEAIEVPPTPVPKRNGAEQANGATRSK
jgi:hypothetical protein